MKKKSLKKLEINKTAISTLTASSVKGGTDSVNFCNSVDACETIDYTRCRGELRCHIYQNPTDGGGSF